MRWAPPPRLRPLVRPRSRRRGWTRSGLLDALLGDEVADRQPFFSRDVVVGRAVVGRRAQHASQLVTVEVGEELVEEGASELSQTGARRADHPGDGYVEGWFSARRVRPVEDDRTARERITFAGCRSR